LRHNRTDDIKNFPSTLFMPFKLGEKITSLRQKITRKKEKEPADSRDNIITRAVKSVALSVNDLLDKIVETKQQQQMKKQTYETLKQNAINRKYQYHQSTKEREMLRSMDQEITKLEKMFASINMVSRPENDDQLSNLYRDQLENIKKRVAIAVEIIKTAEQFKKIALEKNYFVLTNQTKIIIQHMEQLIEACQKDILVYEDKIQRKPPDASPSIDSPEFNKP
jgi:hypothetical protein